jgi:transcriptional regulator with XRE-family HTH domain
MAGDGSGRNVLAERLNHLFATVHPPDRKPYTLREAADAINAEAGVPVISVSYLSQLRAGQRTEPSHSRLMAIARFFGVDVDYFSGEVAAEDAGRQAELLAVMRDAGVRSIALRAHGLSESSLAAVRAVIENARRLEQLPDFDSDSDGESAR